MMIAAGTRLGPYEILAPLGAGGMGGGLPGAGRPMYTSIHSTRQSRPKGGPDDGAGDEADGVL
jgi:hypothetical protein